MTTLMWSLNGYFYQRQNFGDGFFWNEGKIKQVEYSRIPSLFFEKWIFFTSPLRSFFFPRDTYRNDREVFDDSGK